MTQQINDLNSKLTAAQQKTDELSQAVTDAQQTKDLSDDAVNATKWGNMSKTGIRHLNMFPTFQMVEW